MFGSHLSIAGGMHNAVLAAEKFEMETVIREAVDMTVGTDLLNDEQNLDSRLRLRELAQESISSIRLTKIDNGNWCLLVHGIITTTDHDRIPFRYAYHTRRIGLICCDEALPFEAPNDAFRRPVFTNRITDNVKRQLAKLPTREE